MKRKTVIVMALFSIILIVSSGFILSTGYRKYAKNKSVNREIESLKQQASEIAGDKESLSERIAYFQTEEFKERQAKEKLNLKKPDEDVVFIKPTVPSVHVFENTTQELSQEPTETLLPIRVKWWNYFFGSNQSR